MYSTDLCGGRSSAGRAPDCGSGCRRFEPGRSPHLPDNQYKPFSSYRLLLELNNVSLRQYQFKKSKQRNVSD